MSEFFRLEKEDLQSSARAGVVCTDRGEIKTPVFMPVGTQGSVKAIDQKSLEQIDFEIILGNTYHLYLRPGLDVLKHFGGLHKFMNWSRPILTDSGGFQVFSLKELRKLKGDGVEFRSHIDGSKHFFSPEKVIDIQRIIGSDIMMVLDECADHNSTREQALNSLKLSKEWAKRCKLHLERTEPLYGAKQFLFGIGQGTVFPDLRRAYIDDLLEIDFDGYSIGGLSVGEPAEVMYEITEISTAKLPKDKPRYLMGVGTPDNILECIERGIDMFDCVMPTRNARNGQLFTTRGKVNIRNAKYKYSEEPIDPEIDNYPCNYYTLGYLRHLFMADELLGLQIATHQNLNFFKWLTKTAREKILSGEFKSWKTEFLEKFNRK